MGVASGSIRFLFYFIPCLPTPVQVVEDSGKSSIGHFILIKKDVCIIIETTVRLRVSHRDPCASYPKHNHEGLCPSSGY